MTAAHRALLPAHPTAPPPHHAPPPCCPPKPTAHCPPHRAAPSIEIPELEFEVSADGKRKIDSLYNHVASAVWNLSMHVGTTGAGMQDQHKWVRARARAHGGVCTWACARGCTGGQVELGSGGCARCACGCA